MSYPFFQKGVRKRCYWCSEDNKKKLSDDHLPPKSIFPREERDDLQLITATICDSCKKRHQRSGIDDDIFVRHMRLWASLRIGGKDANKRLDECIASGSFTKRNEIVLADFLKVELSDGRTADYPILKNCTVAILAVLDSIARGLYYRIKGQVIPESVTPEFQFRRKGSFNPPMNLLRAMPPFVVKKQVFQCSPVLYREERFNFLCWEFKFYSLDPFPIYYSYEVAGE